MGCGNRIMMMFVRVRVDVRMAVRMLSLVMRVVGILLPWLFFLHDYVNLGRTDTAAIHSENFQGGTKVQGGDRLVKKIWRDTGVNQRAEKHVAADPGEAVDIGEVVLGPWSLVLGRNSVAGRT